jgi:nucleoside-diphosphate-sugar epimerase
MNSITSLKSRKLMAMRALIAGVTGIVGNNLAAHLVSKGWEVHGLARRPQTGIPGVRPVAAELLESGALRSSLDGVDPTHVFITTWVRRATEAENCEVNGAIVRNLLAALDPSEGLRHVALVTGLKHYLGPFDAYAKAKPETPFREEMPRLPVANFYYSQEDEVFEAARQRGFTWSVHRPHTIIGYALGNAMNMGVTLAVYAAICRETGHPFVFPGAAQQWEGLTDVTDARVLARHLEWAATSDAGRNQAFNIVNGDVFRWRWLWPRLAADFGIEAAPYPGRPTPLEPQLADAGPAWAKIAAKHGLAEPDIGKLASAWHTDLDLGREIEVVTDMTKSRLAGFREYQPTLGSFLDLFAKLREDRIIPT